MAERLSLDVALLLFVGCSALLLADALRHPEQWKTRLDRMGLFADSADPPSCHPSWNLFVVSFAALFTEVMMIRWIGTEVRIFAYFQNLSLIACFLGFGLGCYWAHRRTSLLASVLCMTVLIMVIEAPIKVLKHSLEGLSGLLALSTDADLWVSPIASIAAGKETVVLFVLSAVVVFIVLLLPLVGVMIPLGQMVGSYLDSAVNPIHAYSVNLLGSVAGMWAFAALAYFWVAPEYWFGLAFLVLLLIRPKFSRTLASGLALLAVSLGMFRMGRGDYKEILWSPYQKLQVHDEGERNYTVLVNNTGYMWISNLTQDYLERHPEIAQRLRDYSSYDVPFRFARGRDHVLIVGAGAGNDAAAALRNGAGQIDAVEIDPVVFSLGRALHPERPYSSDRVHVVLNDARAFLRQTRQKYDAVLFGLLDSHTQFSDFSNMRLDNYVYTEESLREASRLLKPDGILVVKFEVRRPWTWMGQRFYRMLTEVFGRPPIVFYSAPLGALTSGTVFISSHDPDLWARASRPPLNALISSSPPSFPLSVDGAPPAATDDWPYVYHRGHTIPRTFLVVSLVLLLMTLGLIRGAFKFRQLSTWHFFFLGAGFLLLEVQMVSRLALYFGTTWLVNCVALTSILIVLVAANLYVARVRPSGLAAYFALLVATLVANYLFPWERLTFSSHATGLLLSAAYSLSVFFAGVVFTEMFRRAEGKSVAFGANIVGSVAGGLSQNLSFIFGMKILLLIAAGFYVCAAVSGSRLPHGIRRSASAAASAGA